VLGWEVFDEVFEGTEAWACFRDVEVLDLFDSVMAVKSLLAGVARLEGGAESSDEDEDDVEEALSHEALLLACDRVTCGLALSLCGLALVPELALHVERVECRGLRSGASGIVTSRIFSDLASPSFPLFLASSLSDITNPSLLVLAPGARFFVGFLFVMLA
jgi:hypothetical protein